MNESRGEERIKLKLETDDEIGDKLQGIQNKENFSLVSNVDNKQNQVFGKFDSNQQSELDRQLRQKIKNYQSKQAYLSDAKSQAFAFLISNQQLNQEYDDSLVSNEDKENKFDSDPNFININFSKIPKNNNKKITQERIDPNNLNNEENGIVGSSENNLFDITK